MKIVSSDIHLSSESRQYQSYENTVEFLNEKGQVQSARKSGTVNERVHQDSLQFKAEGETVEISREGRDQRSIETMSASKTGDRIGNADLLRNTSAATAFEWAADTIERFEEMAHGKLTNSKENNSNDAAPASSMPSFHALDSVSYKERIAAYNAPTLTDGMTISKDALASHSDKDIVLTPAPPLIRVASDMRDLASSLRARSPRISDVYSRRETTQHHNIENTQVQADGVIQTADGRTIDFSLTVGMHREDKDEKIETYRVVDPLVINFEGTGAQLKSEKFDFDLDNDGKLEKISKLNEGSGFLALDINKDGEVNSGKELFGPSTGNGFQELALYDSDKNGWIDENDPIWEDLKVWIQDDTEKGVLKKLSDTGIGAIHLGSVASEFLLEDPEGRPAGLVRASGLALTEDGLAKSLQEIDLII